MRRKVRILIINGVLVLALAAAGLGAYVFLWPSADSEAASGVRTTTASRTSVVETVSAAATVQSAYTADADFATTGTVTEVNVKVGDVVAAGQQLAKLDATQASKKVDVAQSTLDAAEEDLANAEEAEDTADTATGDGTGANGGQTGGTQSVASLQAKVDQAELSLQEANDDLDATVLSAPGAGTVTAVSGSVGQRVSGSSGSGSSGTGESAGAGATTGFVVLTDLANLLVKANLAEIDVSKLKAGQEATVTVNALPDKPVAATVTQIDPTPTTTNNVVQFGVALGLTEPPAELRPGQSASVAITVARADDALAVPSAAVRTSGGQHSVTVLANGTEVSRAVQVGVRSEALVQITSGLADGDQVVLNLPSGASGGGNARLTGQLPAGGGPGGGPGGGGGIPGAGR
jgi:macrolide-specific efflux system membrane fusion protein